MTFSDFRHGSVYMSMLLSQFIHPSLPLLRSHIHSLHLCLYFCPANRFICVIYLLLFHLVYLMPVTSGIYAKGVREMWCLDFKPLQYMGPLTRKEMALSINKRYPSRKTLLLTIAFLPKCFISIPLQVFRNLKKKKKKRRKRRTNNLLHWWWFILFSEFLVNMTLKSQSEHIKTVITVSVLGKWFCEAPVELVPNKD